MATYKYNGKTVSEREFKEKVYGKDSKQAQAAKRREEKNKADRDNAGKKGSSYSKVTRRDGTVEIQDRTGKTVETKTAEQVKEENKKTIVVGVGKNKDGSTRVENVGKYLTEQQRREVSKLTSEKGRLSVTQLSQQEVVNDQGQKAVQSNVQFSYKEQQAKQVLNENVKPPAYASKLAQERFAKDPNVQKVTIGEYEFTRTGKTETKQVPEYIGSGGMISAAEKPKGFFKKIEFFLSDKKEKLIYQEQKNTARQEASFKEGAGLFALGVASGVYNTGKAIVRIDKTAVGLYNFGKAAIKNPAVVRDAAVGIGQEFTRNPSGFIGEVVGSAGLFKAIGAAGKAGLAKAKAPKVVSETTGTTQTVNLADDVVKSSSQSTTTIKSGSQKFKVDSVTQTIDRADDAGARLQSSQSSLKISTLDKKGGVKTTNTAFSKANVVASKADDGTILARGDTVQATNIGNKAVVRQGDIAGLGQSFDDGSRLTSIVKTGKAVKSKAVQSADDLQFVDDASKKVSSIESSSRKKILEFDAPQKQSFDTPFGKVEVTSKETFKNTLYDDVANARAGRYLTKADKNTNLKIDPYSRTASQNSVSIQYKGFDDLKAPSPVKPKVRASDKALTVFKNDQNLVLTATDQGFVVSATKISQTTPPIVKPSSSTQALTSVKEITDIKLKGQQAVVDTATKAGTTAKIATIQTTGETKLDPIKYNEVKGATPVSVTRKETQQQAIVKTKSFQSSKVLPVQKVSPAAILDVRTKSKTKQALATKTLVDTATITDTQQKAVLQTATIQKPVVRTRVSQQIVEKINLLNIKPSVQTKKASPLAAGYDVYVRERGSFKKVNTGGLSKADALDLGAYKVSNTPRATFDIRPSSSATGSVSKKVRGAFGAFRQNFVRKGGFFIEKREKRIKSGGEKAGITRKGLLAIKNKKRRGLF